MEAGCKIDVDDKLDYDNSLWRSIMADDTVDEVSASMKNGRTLLRWRYANGPYFYHWFDF